MIKTDWIGLWQSRKAVYCSKPLLQEQILALPKKSRLVLRYNKFYHADSNKPRFVLTFADAEAYDAIAFETSEYRSVHALFKDAIEEIRMIQRIAMWAYDDDSRCTEMLKIESRAEALADELEEALRSD